MAQVNFGSKNIPASTNFPGARSRAVTWRDGNGNVWLFGGQNNNGLCNDLWKYDGANWTWVSGSSTANGAASYGSVGVPSASNVPGARFGAAGAVDPDNNLWLFGGASVSGHHNDLWKYDTTTGEWTWVSGSSAVGATGVYGTKGTAGAGNHPGARYLANAWGDETGHVWIFGGNGNDDGTGGAGDLNDLWEFDGSQWTWVTGAKSSHDAGTYGAKGTASSSNAPSAREGAVLWPSGSGFLLFGGLGIDPHNSGDSGYLNDLWQYQP